MRRFSLSLFDNLNEGSFVYHLGKNSMYDCKLVYNELFSIRSIRGIDRNKRQYSWASTVNKSANDKFFNISDLRKCSNLVYILLENNDLKTTRKKLNEMKVFDILIQDKNIPNYFILNLIELFKADKKLHNALIYEEDFMIDENSFKLLCQHVENKNLIEFFLETVKDIEQYNFVDLLNISIINNNEEAALIILDQFRTRKLISSNTFFLTMKTFFYSKFFDVYQKHKTLYFNSECHELREKIEDMKFSDNKMTNLMAIFYFNWSNFLLEILNICQLEEKIFNFKLIEYSDLKKDNELFKGDLKRNHMLALMSSHNQISLLMHPTTRQLLNRKWAVLPFFLYYYKLLCYLIAIVFYTINSYTVDHYPEPSFINLSNGFQLLFFLSIGRFTSL